LLAGRFGFADVWLESDWAPVRSFSPDGAPLCCAATAAVPANNAAAAVAINVLLM
jgi:hypothetical protein